MLRRITLSAALLLLAGCGSGTPEWIESDFTAGQVWTYRTRPGEGASRVTILRVERFPKGLIVQVAVESVRIAPVPAPITRIPFIVLTEAALKQSVKDVESTLPPNELPPFNRPYNAWLESNMQVYDVPLSEAIDAHLAKKAAAASADPSK